MITAIPFNAVVMREGCDHTLIPRHLAAGIPVVISYRRPNKATHWLGVYTDHFARNLSVGSMSLRRIGRSLLFEPPTIVPKHKFGDYSHPFIAR